MQRECRWPGALGAKPWGPILESCSKSPDQRPGGASGTSGGVAKRADTKRNIDGEGSPSDETRCLGLKVRAVKGTRHFRSLHRK